MVNTSLTIARRVWEFIAHAESGDEGGSTMFLRSVLIGLSAATALGVTAAPANAQSVTYSWTTTSQGFGNHLSQPTTATFDVPLSAVLSGKINYSDITNIHLAYPGLTFDAFTPSSGGLDNAAFVNPVTGAFIYHDADQSLSVAGYQGGLFSSTFLSITIDNRYSPLGQPLTSVADQFNALNNGAPYAGFPTAGYWTASFPVVKPPVPEPATWAMMIVGFGVVGGALRRRPAKVVFA